ncbi:META domain-containing protein [Streptomyces sp. NPDC096132]|uniref:META domain-containing protein n=1 Tax=Streptomyces sp. NPDC096132 TaxID=3366075 RepID=UPI003806BBFA
MKRISRTYAIVATALLTAVLASGCATASAPRSAPSEPGSSPAPLVGVVWKLDSVSVDGKTHSVPDDTDPWMEFDAAKGMITGHDGCNHFESDAVIGTGTVTLAGDLLSTAIGCYPSPDAAPEFTESFPPRSGSLRAETTADTLTLTAADGVSYLLHAEKPTA